MTRAGGRRVREFEKVVERGYLKRISVYSRR